MDVLTLALIGELLLVPPIWSRAVVVLAATLTGPAAGAVLCVVNFVGLFTTEALLIDKLDKPIFELTKPTFEREIPVDAYVDDAGEELVILKLGRAIFCIFIF